MLSAELTEKEENDLLSLRADSEENPADVADSVGNQGGDVLETAASATAQKRPKPRKSEIHAKKNLRNKSDDELYVEFDNYLESISNEDTCYSQTKGTCTCLHILRQPHLRAAVAKYKMSLAKKSKHEIDCIIFEWYRYAKACAGEKSGRHKPYWYMIPFDGTDALANNINIRELVSARMCQQALYRVMGISESRFATIRQASITGAVPRHASTGKRSHNAISDTVRTIAIGHFEELCQLGAQSPTSKASANDGVADINLPLPYSARACYRIYLKQLGYSATYKTTGATSVQWEGDEEDEKPKYMSATTYFTLWKSEFPHLKVSFVDIVAFS